LYPFWRYCGHLTDRTKENSNKLQDNEQCGRDSNPVFVQCNVWRYRYTILFGLKNIFISIVLFLFFLDQFIVITYAMCILMGSGKGGENCIKWRNRNRNFDSTKSLGSLLPIFTVSIYHIYNGLWRSRMSTHSIYLNQWFFTFRKVTYWGCVRS
jgi:hypothetical protein